MRASFGEVIYETHTLPSCPACRGARRLGAGPYDDLQSGHTGTVNAIAFSPDDRYLATASGDQSVKLWDLQTGLLIRTLIGHNVVIDGVTTVAFSPNGKTIASGGMEIILWDAVTGARLKTLDGTGVTYSLDYSPDGRYIVASGTGKLIELWDARSGALLRTFAGHTAVVRTVVFSPDGKQAASGSEDRSIMIWDVETGACVRKIEKASDKSMIMTLAYSLDGSRLFAVLETSYPHQRVITNGKAADEKSFRLGGAGEMRKTL